MLSAVHAASHPVEVGGILVLFGRLVQCCVAADSQRIRLFATSKFCHETAEWSDRGQTDTYNRSQRTSKPPLNLPSTAVVNDVLRHNARTGSWEGFPRLPCIGEALMGAYGESGHCGVKKMEVVLLL